MEELLVNTGLIEFGLAYRDRWMKCDCDSREFAKQNGLTIRELNVLIDLAESFILKEESLQI